MRGYASQCDALLKAGEAIRTPDIHVGNVQVYRLNAINNADFERGVTETVTSSLHDEVLVQLNQNWQHLPEHIKLAIQALVRAGGV